MNVLYVSYSCDPYNGTEDKLGWSIPEESSKRNNVTVVTKEEHRASIEKYMKIHPDLVIDVHYIDVPQIYKTVFRGFWYSMRMNIWNRRAFYVVKSLCKEKGIQIIHQVTPVEFRSIGNYGKIVNCKYICGPVGGAEYTPVALKDYTKGHTYIENIRRAINWLYRVYYSLTGRLSSCDYLMLANQETKEYLYSCIRSCETEVMTEIGVGLDEISLIKESTSDIRVFLVAGRLIYRKGHKLLFDALKQLPKDLDYQCRIVGSGSEMQQLQDICKNDPYLKKHVVFTGKIPYTQMEKEYKNADVLIMPSLRETTGSVILEAMSKGIPVVTINKYGGRVILDSDVAWLYDGSTKDEIVGSLALKIQECILEPKEVVRKKQNAVNKARQYSWKNRCEKYQKIYERVWQ